MRSRVRPSPLAAAALALIESGVTPQGLVTRFAANDALITRDIAKVQLDELDDLGLVRVVQTADETRYYRTPLGDRLLQLSFAARPEQVELLAEIEHMRTDLLSTIAHELRTPLTAVRTSIGLLLDPSVEPDGAQRRALLETIDRNATRMQRVVGDILDLARFRAGRIQLQLRRFDAAELATSAVASVRPLAEARGQTIVLDLPSAPIFVFADFRRLEQALVNLLSNAGKYSPDGATISLRTRSTDTDVSWSVADTGPGIAPADRARLFERFFVARGDTRQSETGIGLGLPITLLIVQAHGGRIDVRSRVGHGSTFTITIPLSGPAEAQAE